MQKLLLKKLEHLDLGIDRDILKAVFLKFFLEIKKTIAKCVFHHLAMVYLKLTLFTLKSSHFKNLYFLISNVLFRKENKTVNYF